MDKITKDYLQEYVSEVGEFEKEHRKYSSFYCWVSHTFSQKDVNDLAKEDVDASDFLNVCVSLSGMWDDSNGTDWDSMDYYKVEDYQELVPEQIIPAHYVTKQKTEKFIPNWE